MTTGTAESTIGREAAVAALLREALADPETAWSLGSFGAIAEFMRDPGEAVHPLPDARLGVAPHSLRAVAPGDFAGLAALTGPHPRAGWPEFRRDYVAICTRTGGSAEACRIAARCTAEALRAEGLWSRGERSFTTPERLRAQRLSGDCYAAAEGSAPPP